MRWVRWICALLLAGAAWAAEPAVDAALAAAGWRPLGFDGKAANRFRLVEDAVEVASESSVSLLYRAVTPDLARTPCLAWRWRVERSMPPTDLSRHGGDDRPAAVYVTFPYDPAEATVAERMKRVLVELVQGRDAPGRALVYVWGGTAARGAVLESPYMGSAGALIVLRGADAPLERWFEERVNIAADYARVFRRPPRPPSQLAIGADSDDTRSSSLARVADLGFRACG